MYVSFQWLSPLLFRLIQLNTILSTLFLECKLSISAQARVTTCRLRRRHLTSALLFCHFMQTFSLASGFNPTADSWLFIQCAVNRTPQWPIYQRKRGSHMERHVHVSMVSVCGLSTFPVVATDNLMYISNFKIFLSLEF